MVPLATPSPAGALGSKDTTHDGARSPDSSSKRLRLRLLRLLHLLRLLRLS